MVDQVGKVAAAAKVGTLVLSHLVPHDGIDDEEWRAAVGDDFTGHVVVGHDLQRFEIGAQPPGGDRRRQGSGHA